MRPYLLLLIPLLIACERSYEVESLGEYDISFEKGVLKKIYKYVRQPGGDTVVHEYLFRYLNNDHETYTQISSVNSIRSYERVYQVKNNHKKFISEYYYQQREGYPGTYEKLKGDIQAYEEIDLGHRFKGLKTKISFTNEDGFVTTLLEKDTSIKDTTLSWQNELLPVLKLGYTSTTTETIKYLPFIPHTSEYKGTSFYAKGVGLLKWRVWDNNEVYETTLISIEKVILK